MRSFLKPHGNGTVIEILVSPGSSRNRIGGEHNQRLKCFVAAAPEKGKANQSVVEMLARLLGCGKRDIEILRGETAREKTLLVKLSIEQVEAALDASQIND